MAHAAGVLCDLGDYRAVPILLMKDAYWWSHGLPDANLQAAFSRMRSDGAREAVRAGFAAGRFVRRRAALALIIQGDAYGVELLVADCATSGPGLKWKSAIDDLVCVDGDLSLICSTLDNVGNSISVEELRYLASVPNYSCMKWVDHEPILMNSMESGSRSEWVSSSQQEVVTSFETIRQRAQSELTRRGLRLEKNN